MINVFIKIWFEDLGKFIKLLLVSISVSSISTSPGLSLAFVVKRGSRGGGEIVEGISEIPKYPIKFHKVRKS